MSKEVPIRDNTNQTVALGDILTTEQIERCRELLGFLTPDILHNELARYLKSIKPSLIKRGIEPHYLAYWFEYAVMSGKITPKTE